MKKFASVLLAVLVAFSMFSFVVSAADASITVAADKTNVKVGDTVTVTVALDDNSGLGGLTIKADYDSSVLKATAMTAGTLGATVNVETGIATMASATTFEDAGTICVMTFEAIAAGTAAVTFVKDEAFDGEFADAALNIGTATITVAADEEPSDEPTEDPSEDNECEHEVMTDWTVVKSATCKVDGKKTRNCTVCDYSESEAIAATGVCSYKWVVTKEATATQQGEKVLKCTMCGDVKETVKLEVVTDTLEQPAIPNTDAIA